ncbi:MAG: hypothetical protein U1B83_04060, partial [Candidatus Cloacimonadaceae bacterium]|nr:hypothetical protein [Candidatus Cloacimonadaceae bacterium]
MFSFAHDTQSEISVKSKAESELFGCDIEDSSGSKSGIGRANQQEWSGASVGSGDSKLAQIGHN